MITFDDGYRDVLGKASPVLQRLQMHATAFVITSRISGPDPSFLTWPQLTALERRGIEIGSHTVHHAELPGLSDASAQAELEGRASVARVSLTRAGWDVIVLTPSTRLKDAWHASKATSLPLTAFSR